MKPPFLKIIIIIIIILIVLEYLEGGSIPWTKDNLPVLSIEASRTYFRDILAGLQYRKFFSFIWFLIYLILIIFENEVSMYNYKTI